MTRRKFQKRTRLKEARGKISQKEFAKKIGISHKSYQNYESGKRIPRGDVLLKIVQFCDVTIDWLLMRDSVLGMTERLLEKEKMISQLKVLFDEFKGKIDRLI